MIKIRMTLHNTSVDDAISEFLNARRAERLSENTILYYRNGLRRFAAWAGYDRAVETIKPADIRAFLSDQDDVSDRTLVHYYNALSVLWSWLVKQKKVDENVIRLVDAPKPEEREIIPFSREEIVKLLHATDRSVPYQRDGQRKCDHATRTGMRDRAIIYMLLDTGLRASELTSLRVRDLHETGCKVFGKGKKERWVPYSPTTREFILAYLDTRKNLQQKDRVFPLKRRALDSMLERLQNRSGVPDVHAHRFRHTFAITYLRNGGDPYSLQKILGHTSMDMVRRYLAIARADLEHFHSLASPVERWHI